MRMLKCTVLLVTSKMAVNGTEWSNFKSMAQSPFFYLQSSQARTCQTEEAWYSNQCNILFAELIFSLRKGNVFPASKCVANVQ